MPRTGSGTGSGGGKSLNTGPNASKNSKLQRSGGSDGSSSGGSSASSSGIAVASGGPMYMPTVPGMTCHVIGGGPAAVTSTGQLVIDAPEELGVNALIELLASPTSGGSGTSSSPLRKSSSVADLAALRRSFAEQIGKADALNDSALQEQIAMHDAIIASPPAAPAPAPAPSASTANPSGSGNTPATAEKTTLPLLDNWVQQTTVKHAGPINYPRSAELKAVDRAVAQYNQTRSAADLRALAEAVNAWRSSKDNWQNSIRAQRMQELIALIGNEHYRNMANALRANLQGFLQVHPLMVSGSSDGIKDFRFHDTQPSGFDALLAPPQVLKLGPTNPGPSVTMDSVKMYTDIRPNQSREANLALIEEHFHPLSGEFMTTGLLSGCVFITRRNPETGAFECTHIQPLPGQGPEFWENGQALHDYIRSLGISGTDVRIWGRRDYDNRTTIMGDANPDGTWNVYAQRIGFDREKQRQYVQDVVPIVVNG